MRQIVAVGSMLEPNSSALTLRFLQPQWSDLPPVLSMATETVSKRATRAKSDSFQVSAEQIENRKDAPTGYEATQIFSCRQVLFLYCRLFSTHLEGGVVQRFFPPNLAVFCVSTFHLQQHCILARVVQVHRE